MSVQPSAVVVGNSIAAMVAAMQLGESGWSVALVAPSRRLGGHFAGLTIEGRAFDAGMVFLEFTSFNADASADLSSYDPTRRNDVGRFFPRVESFFSALGDWRTVETPSILIDGRTLPDLLIANRLETLLAFPPQLRAAMACEVGNAAAGGPGPLHPSRKASDPRYDVASLEEASHANHGETLHRCLIEPFCRKVTARPSAGLLARYHRLAWAPLFYPETLHSALRGEAVSLPETSFSSPKCGSVASLVHGLEARLRATGGVQVIEGAVEALSVDRRSGRATLTLSHGGQLSADRLAWAADQERLLSLCGDPAPGKLDRASVTLVSMLVSTEAIMRSFSTLLVPQDEALPFRVTNQSLGAGERTDLSRLSCEWNAVFLEGTSGAMSASAVEAMIELGIVGDPAAVRQVRVDVVKDALLLPTAANVTEWSGRRKRLEALLPTVAKLGPSAPFGATSLNDQVVQGLKVVHDFQGGA